MATSDFGFNAATSKGPAAFALELKLLGEFGARLSIDGAPSAPLVGPLLSSRKAQELLAFLALNAERLHHRNALSRLLWPNSSNARRYLRQAIWTVRSSLRLFGCNCEAVLAGEDEEWLGLAAGVELKIDALKLKQQAEQHMNADRRASQLRDAVECLSRYHGDFLPSSDSSWVVMERRNFEALYFRLAGHAIEECIQEKNFSLARSIGNSALYFDIAHEATHSKLMRIHHLTGDRTAALRQYQLCAAALLREFGAEPGLETQCLYRELHETPLSPINPPPPSTRSNYAPPPSSRLNHALV